MRPGMNWEMIGGLVALAGAVLLAIIVLELVKRWIRKPEPMSQGEEINHFRRLKDEGLLTEEEFARVQSSVEKWTSAPPLPQPSSPPREERIFDASARERVRLPAESPAQPSAVEAAAEQSPHDSQAPPAS